MISPALAIRFSDGSLSILAPSAREDEALTLCDEANALEPYRARQVRVVRVVRVAVEVVEDLFATGARPLPTEDSHGR